MKYKVRQDLDERKLFIGDRTIPMWLFAEINEQYSNERECITDRGSNVYMYHNAWAIGL